VIVIPANTPLLHSRIIQVMQARFPILENPIGSNRSPEIDAMARKWGIPLGSPWCAGLATDVWQEAGAEVPPVDDEKGWHPWKAETWRQWALATNRFSSRPIFGGAVLYGLNGNKPAEHIAVCVVSLVPILMDIEGNTSETGFSREGELTGLKRVNGDRLIGYVSPEPLTREVSI
jgi:hypothetical protein